MIQQSASGTFLEYVDSLQVVIGTLADQSPQSALAAVSQVIQAIPRELTVDESYVVRNILTDLVRSIALSASLPRISTNLLAEIMTAGTSGSRMASTFTRYLKSFASERTVSGQIAPTSRRVNATLEASDCEHPNAARIARVVVSVANSPADPTNLHGLWLCSNASPGTLKNWCRAAKLTTRDVRQFARGLRVVVLYYRDGTHPHDLLNIVDGRTRAKFLKKCGGDPSHPFRLPENAAAYIEKQTFISNAAVLHECRQLLDAGWPLTR